MLVRRVEQVDVFFKNKETMTTKKRLDGITRIEFIKIGEFGIILNLKDFLFPVVNDPVIPGPKNHFCHQLPLLSKKLSKILFSYFVELLAQACHAMFFPILSLAAQYNVAEEAR